MKLDRNVFFFFNDTATTEIYTLSLHDALPISRQPCHDVATRIACWRFQVSSPQGKLASGWRSEEHTSELQSRLHLVCRLLLEKKTQSPAAASGRPSTPYAAPPPGGLEPRAVQS